jgi:hypothetical protein
MIATTIISSIRVKPELMRFIPPSHSQQPTRTVNFSAFSAMSGSSSFSVDPAFSNGTLLEDRKPLKQKTNLKSS